jgi:hypothetical protein
MMVALFLTLHCLVETGTDETSQSTSVYILSGRAAFQQRYAASIVYKQWMMILRWIFVCMA